MTETQKRIWYSATAGLHDMRRDCLEELQRGQEPDAAEMLARLKRVEVELLKVALVQEGR